MPSYVAQDVHTVEIPAGEKDNKIMQQGEMLCTHSTP